MTRHSKNCTANTVYTYHEKKKDTKNSGYGTTTVRVGRDSIRNFDCCCLTLQPSPDPVVTTDGFLYDKAAILEYIVNEKADIQRRLKLYEKQVAREKTDKEEKEKTEKEKEAKRFLAFNTLESHTLSATHSTEREPLTGVSLRRAVAVESIYKPGKAASFWHPTTSLSKNADIYKLPPVKPDTVVRCPMSRRPLRYKDLIPVHFKILQKDDETLFGKETKDKTPQYCCAVSSDHLTNATACAVLKTSGAVVTQKVVDTVLRKDMHDPINGKPLCDDDFILLNCGSLGFANERISLTAKRNVAVMHT